MSLKYLTFFLFIYLFIAVTYSSDVIGQEKVYKASMDQDGIQRVEIVGGEYYFEPEHIIVRIGVPVEFRVRKEPALVPHNIVMNEPEAGMEFREDFGTEPKVIAFTPQKTGKFPFYCTKKFLFFKSHREKGMKGVIEVIE